MTTATATLADFLMALFPAGGLLDLRALPGAAQAFVPSGDLAAVRAFVARHHDRGV